MLAIGVKFRFNQFNLRLKAITRDENLMTELNFRKMRIHFFKLIDLVFFVDSQLSSLILVSFGHSMLVIMVKVFSALKYEKEKKLNLFLFIITLNFKFSPNRYMMLDDIYFWFYLIFLLVRVYCTLYSCASIHETALYPLDYFGKIPSHLWTLDVSMINDVLFQVKCLLLFFFLFLLFTLM